MQSVDKKQVFLVYDHDCPVCRAYCTRALPVDDKTEIRLVNARDDTAIMPDITERGMDIDQGMVLKVGHDLYYGSEAVFQLQTYKKRSWIDRLLFATRARARVMYPAGKAVRNMLLRILGVPFIENLKPENALKHQLGASWARLRAGIQERFLHEPQADEVFVYDGTMHVIRRSRAGWLFAQLTRIIGSPLLPYAGADVPTQVRLYAKDSGVCWERTYHYPNRKPAVVSSVKRESAEGEMMEVVGGGFGMKLRVFTADGQLYFTSYGYFCTLLGWRITLPHLLTPGQTQVAHLDHGDGSFTFRLGIRHPWLGETFFQEGRFRRRLAKDVAAP